MTILRTRIVACVWCLLISHCGGVEETGLFDPGQIIVTSDADIGTTERTLFVVGEPYAIQEGDVEVANTRTGVTVNASVNAQGAFRAEILGQLDDQISVTRAGESAPTATVVVQSLLAFPATEGPMFFQTVADDTQPRRFSVRTQLVINEQFYAVNVNSGEVLPLVQGNAQPRDHKEVMVIRSGETVHVWLRTQEGRVSTVFAGTAP